MDQNGTNLKIGRYLKYAEYMRNRNVDKLRAAYERAKIEDIEEQN